MGLRGPQPQGNDVRLDLKVSSNVDRALDQLVDLSGVAKATFVRQALLDMLSTLGLVYPEIAESLKPTRTKGRTSTANPEKEMTMATLPEFPRSGHGTSAQLNTNRERYRAAADELRAELARAEDTFTLALAEHDQPQQTRDRLAAMAKARRTTGRRN